MNERIESLEKMLEKDPDDLFAHYSLGMEYASAGQYDQAVAEFQRCIELEADYLAAYVEGAKSLRSAGRLGEARKMFSAAMELAARIGEKHACDFIQQQLDSIAPGACL